MPPHLDFTPQGSYPVRYEDVAQDGRVLLLPLTTSLGSVWSRSIRTHPLVPFCEREGVLPILTRLLVTGAGGPFGIDAALEVEGGFALTKTVDAQGATDKLLLEIRTRLFAPRGRTNLPPPDDAGTRDCAGSVLAEHVFTRPFAPREQRRVRELPDFGGPPFPVVDWSEPRELLQLPPGAKALDALSTDPTPLAFGLTHTDSNQHVNSLVYPRLFEEAALRRLAGIGRSREMLARTLDVRFRKPSFAGDRLTLMLRVFEREGQLGALGAFVEPGGAPENARACIQMTFG